MDLCGGTSLECTWTPLEVQRNFYPRWYSLGQILAFFQSNLDLQLALSTLRGHISPWLLFLVTTGLSLLGKGIGPFNKKKSRHSACVYCIRPFSRLRSDGHVGKPAADHIPINSLSHSRGLQPLSEHNSLTEGDCFTNIGLFVQRLRLELSVYFHSTRWVERK